MPAALLRFSSAFAAAATAAALGCARAEEAAERTAERAAERAPPRHQCYSTAQTREKIEDQKLTDPFSCMRAAAQQLNGEALGAKLCRLEEFLVYEISILRPDGRIVKMLFDAITGGPRSAPRPGRKEN